MTNPEHLCMSCMKEIGDEKQCPFCGFHADSPQLSPYLPLRTVISGRYLAGKLLEYNGDGATYIGWDLTQRTPVLIREFLPDAVAQRKSGSLGLQVLSGCEITFRDCYQSFLDLWRKLVRMRGLSALILAFDIVEDYGTAYAISEYTESITLRDYLLRSASGYLPWEQVRSLFMPVLSTLGTLHSSGIIHRGISPTTLLIGKDGKMRISGFSIWQARTARGDLTAQLYSGYAAIEQYGFDGQQGSWTDIYAFAAVLYRTLVGSTPLEATSRVTNDKLMVPAKFAEQIPAYVINALVNALQILPEDRTRTVEQLRAELSASPSAVNASAGSSTISMKKAEAPMPVKEEAQRRNRRTLALKAAGLSAMVCVAIFLVLALTVFRGSIFPEKEPTLDTSPSTEAVSQEALTIPKFVGMYRNEIELNGYWNQVFNITFRTAYSDTVEKDFVIQQSIPNGQTVSAEEGKADIELTVSLGVELVEVPTTLKGMKSTDAMNLLSGAPLKFTSIDPVLVGNDGSAVAGTVMDVFPQGGTKIKRGDPIILYVYDQPANNGSTVPSGSPTAP